MKKASLLITLLLTMFTSRPAIAQDIAPQDLEKLHYMEDSLLTTADSMYEAFIPDVHIVYSERFARQLVRALKLPNSYYYPFDKLKEKINLIYADDNGFRIFNWEIVTSKSARRYYGAIQMPTPGLKLYGLLDYSDELSKGAEDSVLTGGKWFGGIIYRIMSEDFKGQKVYTLFSFNQGSAISNKKILDPLLFTPQGIRFGAPIFAIASENYRSERINRFVLEYKKDVQVSMNWNDEKKVIMFDKLISQINDPGRKYTYVPSGEYDGLRWTDEEGWNYVRDLIPVNIMREGQEPPSDTK